MSRFTLALGIALLLVEASVAVAILATSDEVENPWLAITLAVSAGAAFVVSGLIAVVRRPENRTGALLAATGYVWFLGALSPSGNDWLFTVGFVLGNLVWAPFSALVLAFPTGRLQTRLERAIPVAVGVLLVVPAFLAVLLDPRPAQDCTTCGDSAIAIGDVPGVAAALDTVTTVCGLALIGIVVTILVRRWRGASPALRRLLRPVIGAGIATLLAVALVVIAELVSSTAADALQLLFFAAFAAVPIAFLYGILRTRLARASVSNLVVALEAGIPLRDALATALGDPALEVAYWLDWRRGPGGPGWVDAEGRAVPDIASDVTRAVRHVEQDGERVAALLYDRALDSEPELLDAVTAAAKLALQNERLYAELRAEVAFMNTVTNTAPSLLVNVGTDGRIRNVNAAALEASGFDDEETVRGRYFWDVFIDSSEREAIMHRFAEAAPEFAASEYENRFTNARGERLVIYWRSAPVENEQGRVVSVVAGGLDITERERREEEIRTAEERLRATVQGAPVAITEVGLDDRVRLWNPAAERILGWPAEEVVGGVVPNVPPEREAEFRTLLERIREGEAFTGLETEALRSDGTRIDVEISVVPMRDAAGAVVGHIGVLSDISGRKRHEAELRASRARIVTAGDEARQRLERDLHDGAQQRLVALSVSLRLAESKLAGDPAAAAEIIAGAREELAQALDELRELARGIHPAVLTDRGLAPAVEGLVARTPVPVDVDVCQGRLPAAVEAASYYVVAEALTNVAKYAKASGARVQVTREDSRVLIEVSDDGAGGADPSRGSGLRGLSDRIAALDGILVVQSPPGQGTTVRAEIPLGEGTAAQ